MAAKDRKSKRPRIDPAINADEEGTYSNQDSGDLDLAILDEGRRHRRHISQTRRRGYAALRSSSRRTENPETRFSGTSDRIITRGKAIEEFLSGIFRHELFFLVPGGARRYENVVAYKPKGGGPNPYFLHESNASLARIHSFEDGTRFVFFGAGTGDVEAAMLPIGDRKKIYVTSIDMARESRFGFIQNMKAKGVPENQIRFIPENIMNFSPSGIWNRDFWNSLRGDNGDDLTIVAIGILINFITEENKRILTRLHAVTRPGDKVRLQFDGTLRRDILLPAYGGDKNQKDVPPFKNWFVPGYRFLCEKKIGLMNLRDDQIRYEVEIVEEEGGAILNVRGLVRVGRHHPIPRLSPDLQSYLNGEEGRIFKKPFMKKVNNFGGSAYEVLSSRRVPREQDVSTLLDECGWRCPKGRLGEMGCSRPSVENYYWDIEHKPA